MADNPRTLLRGLLRSKNFLDYASRIPCNIIQTLENDAEEAEKFVTQIQQGKVPDLITDLPDEVIGTFSDVINIAVTLPTALLGAAQSVVTDAAKLFNDIEDGTITDDLASVPGIVVSDVTAGWAGFTSGLVDAWDHATEGIGCFFGDCPTPTAPAGNSCAAATSSASTLTRTIVLTTAAPIPQSSPTTPTSTLRSELPGQSVPTEHVPTPTTTIPALNTTTYTIGSPTTQPFPGNAVPLNNVPIFTPAVFCLLMVIFLML